MSSNKFPSTIFCEIHVSEGSFSNISLLEFAACDLQVEEVFCSYLNFLVPARRSNRKVKQGFQHMSLESEKACLKQIVCQSEHQRALNERQLFCTLVAKMVSCHCSGHSLCWF